MLRKFDLVVIGTGSAAATVAYECRKAGWEVAIIDSRDQSHLVRRQENHSAALCMFGSSPVAPLTPFARANEHSW